MTRTCVLCDADRLRPFVRAADGSAVERCTRCGFTALVAGSDAAAAYDSIYAAEEHMHPLTRDRYVALTDGLARFRRTGTLLEVGFGRGEFLRVARERGWNVVGTEVSARAVENLRHEGFAVQFGENAVRSLAGAAFDAVVALEVIEHVADFRSLLAEAHDALRPGGALLLSTPNVDSLTRRIIGARWRIFASEHHWYFSPSTLTRALRDAGFRVERMESRNIYPPDLIRAFRATVTRSSDTSDGWAASSGLRDFALRTRFGGVLRTTVNAMLRSSGAGDTIWAWAVR